MKTVARLIQEDVKSIEKKNEQYDIFESFSSDVNQQIALVPKLLKIFLETLFGRENFNLKVASIGQAIMQTSRPKMLLMPLQLGLSIQMHHHFGSRFLIDILFKMGFSCSYAEIQKFERSAAACLADESVPEHSNFFLQFIADNVDHNVATIDGQNTFHGMGIIATIMPKVVLNKPIYKIDIKTQMN